MLSTIRRSTRPMAFCEQAFHAFQNLLLWFAPAPKNTTHPFSVRLSSAASSFVDNFCFSIFFIMVPHLWHACVLNPIIRTISRMVKFFVFLSSRAHVRAEFPAPLPESSFFLFTYQRESRIPCSASGVSFLFTYPRESRIPCSVAGVFCFVHVSTWEPSLLRCRSLFVFIFHVSTWAPNSLLLKGVFLFFSCVGQYDIVSKKI